MKVFRLNTKVLLRQGPPPTYIAIASHAFFKVTKDSYNFVFSFYLGDLHQIDIRKKEVK